MFALVALTFRVKLVTFSVIKVRKLLRQMGELVLQKDLLSGVDFMKRSHVKKHSYVLIHMMKATKKGDHYCQLIFLSRLAILIFRICLTRNNNPIKNPHFHISFHIVFGIPSYRN